MNNNITELMSKEISLQGLYEYAYGNWMLMLGLYIGLTTYIGWKTIRKINKRDNERGAGPLQGGDIALCLFIIAVSSVWVPFYVIAKVFSSRVLVTMLDLEGKKL